MNLEEHFQVSWPAIALIVFGAVNVTGLILGWRAVRRVTTAVGEMHLLINSRMDELLKAEKAASLSQGQEEGKTIERSEERARRKEIIERADENAEI